MPNNNIRKKAEQFVSNWSKKGFNFNENGNVAPFWRDLLSGVYGENNTTDYIQFEKKVPNMRDNINFIDAYISLTKVLIEQKGPNIDLSKKEHRSSFRQYNEFVTPFEQAKTYNDNLPYSQRARWIITCNFQEFRIYDMEKSGTHPKPVVIKLLELPHYYYKMDFLIDPTRQDIKRETKVSLEACDIIDEIYYKFLDQYNENEKTTKVLSDINKICVRLVFCMYADDSGIFGKYNMFEEYMKPFPARIWNAILRDLFYILNQPENERDLQTDKDLLRFPYVNGGMFYDNPKDKVHIPRFTPEMKDLILNKACAFDWSLISPTIFGSLFEGTLNPKERRKNGMHYTSVENIHKLIDPLFLNEFRDELNTIKTNYVSLKSIKNNAQKFQNKLANLDFLDPACGSGNFLTETYLSLRKLENEAIKLIYGTDNNTDNGYIQTALGLDKNPIKVSIHQFYGVEINNFAVSVARTAMWIAESQTMQETQDIINQNIKFLPLKSNPNIIEDDALKVDWSTIIKPYHLDYIISNPPFVSNKKDKQQRNDMKKVMTGFKNIGQLDLVAAWYKKSADMMKLSPYIQTALVSTNSITLGQQVSLLWKSLLQNYGLHINFAYQSFDWKNDAKKQAIVSCVIISFSYYNKKHKIIFKNNNNTIKKTISKSGNINPYLKDMKNTFVTRRNSPLNSNAKKMMAGSNPNDKGFLSNYSDEEKKDICKKYPKAIKLFKRFIGSNEFLHNRIRWCIWLYNDEDWNSILPIKKAVSQVRIFRSQSKRKGTRKSANIPYLFQELRQPKSDYLFIPKISTLKRKYIPIGFISKNIIVNDLALTIPNASYYDFGILTSIVHVIWAKLVSGRMRNESFCYSVNITYNNFPFITPTNNQKEIINHSAQKILTVREQHPKKTMSQLYDPNSMPVDLQKAHKINDKNILKLYGLKTNATEEEILTKLLKLYNKMTNCK